MTTLTAISVLTGNAALPDQKCAIGNVRYETVIFSSAVERGAASMGLSIKVADYAPPRHLAAADAERGG